jgi:hypothetical protein
VLSDESRVAFLPSDHGVKDVGQAVPRDGLSLPA